MLQRLAGASASGAQKDPDTPQAQQQNALREHGQLLGFREEEAEEGGDKGCRGSPVLFTLPPIPGSHLGQCHEKQQLIWRHSRRRHHRPEPGQILEV